jgi:hypothetical protein
MKASEILRGLADLIDKAATVNDVFASTVYVI